MTGEIAQSMLDGTLCAQCGAYLGTNNGYPTYCRSCRKNAPIAKHRIRMKLKCPHCPRHVKLLGLKDHLRDVHNISTEGQP